jgi:hypothetical protein
MNTILKYAKEFWDRHDISYEELKTLSDRHPSVKINFNIPVAWIVLVDELLCRFRYNQVIEEIGQEFGQLIVVLKKDALLLKDRDRNRPEDQGQLIKYKEVVEQYDRRIREIDIDLAKKYGLEI